MDGVSFDPFSVPFFPTGFLIVGRVFFSLSFIFNVVGRVGMKVDKGLSE